ncbi:hypothetical protein GS18_0210680 [Metabacillus indicus]|uniref:Uncharacterized protein n=1 Tax=Metabacillus indicus TaxID=246786 RepID=A0A084GW78_METID|nr:hypothetical protein GS18_0210680 [Metabacillus indicus]
MFTQFIHELGFLEQIHGVKYSNPLLFGVKINDGKTTKSEENVKDTVINVFYKCKRTLGKSIPNVLFAVY